MRLLPTASSAPSSSPEKSTARRCAPPPRTRTGPSQRHLPIGARTSGQVQSTSAALNTIAGMSSFAARRCSVPRSAPCGQSKRRFTCSMLPAPVCSRAMRASSTCACAGAASTAASSRIRLKLAKGLRMLRSISDNVGAQMTPELKLLLVEDDGTSATFLLEALALLPAQVELAGSIGRARELAFNARHDLWLVDAHLPDGDGLACRRALRAMRDTPALAITAGAPAAELDALCAGGFVEVLLKPVSIALLQATVRRVLAIAAPELPEARIEAPAGGKQPVWEQQRALAAIGGNATSLA